MKIIADENIPFVEEFFGELGEITRLPGRKMTCLDVKDADILLVRSVTGVNKNLLEQSAVKFVGTCTIGVDHLDIPYLTEQGIHFSNAPGSNANSVVEYVYAALSQLGVSVGNKTVGIIGCGNVGGLLHKRLKVLGVSCRCYDPFLNLDQNADLTTLEEVLQCDIISMHTPLTTTGPHPSKHLISLPELRQLKAGAVLLNCGRGAVLDNQALLTVLNERDDLSVVLDVWEPEPNISLALFDKVKIGTPHIAGYSYDGKIKGTAMIYQAYCEYAGIKPSIALLDVIPKVENPEKELQATGVEQKRIDQLILQTYNISDDDARLRALAEGDDESFAAGFDLLRKQYPIRREFSNFNVAGDVDTLLAEKIIALGFTIKNV